MNRAAAPLWLALIVAGSALAARPAAAPRAAQWIAPGALVAVLSSEPGSCLTIPADPQRARSIAIGAAAFRAPLLLGGQAARSGLSCNSCHRGGHDNPAFSYPGISGAPGTADVTASLFSSHRGDGLFNPRPITNLSGDKQLLRIDQGALAPFILGQITEEFDGPVPPPAVLTGLADYVRALSPAACTAPVAIDLAGALRHVDAALGNAKVLAAAGDGAAARLMVSAARSELGLIDERYALPGLASQAAPLRRAAAALGAIERRMTADPAGTFAALERWQHSAAAWQVPLRRSEVRSLYNPEVLARTLSSGQ